MENLLELSPEEARRFFLSQSSYCNINLPPYFNFQPLLDAIENSGLVPSTPPPNLQNTYTKFLANKRADESNYQLYTNKDGEFAWRRLQIINPIAYVYLVYQITTKRNWNHIKKRFKKFQSNQHIKCCSLPICKHESDNKSTNIENWWHNSEQKSVELSMDYTYMLTTDITNCYGSFYTHSIAWAVNNKNYAKKHPKTVCLGNVIDKVIRDISNQQTNGIPQGSVLMDFIAEIILGYADRCLSKKLKREGVPDYYILRYRDDYRIFTNEKEAAIKIAKVLTETLAELNLTLNTSKTSISDNIISDSIKPAKLAELDLAVPSTIQKKLLQIHHLAINYPNSGSIEKRLCEIDSYLVPTQLVKENINVITSILVDIAFRNPRTYPIVTILLGKICPLLCKEQSTAFFKKVNKKFEKLPNTEFLSIWLQRLVVKNGPVLKLNSKLCRYADQVKKHGKSIINIWEPKDKNFKNIFISHPIVDADTINQMPVIPNIEEVRLFWHY